MFKRTQESTDMMNFHSRIFLETQEDFVFSRDGEGKRDCELFQEEISPSVEDWLEVERILR